MSEEFKLGYFEKNYRNHPDFNIILSLREKRQDNFSKM